MSRLLISIITVNFNNKHGLIKTLNSIKSQKCNSFEHIIIDANSTDESTDIIKQYEKEVTYPLYWTSEPDKGIYDGMNKGIKQAHGEYLYFLNSGDVLMDSTILQKLPLDGSKYIYGNIKYVLSTSSYRNISPAATLDIIYLLKTALPHQACFIHHSLFHTQLYNTKYKIISDWIHTMKSIIFEGCSYKHIDITIAEVDGTGISSNQEKLMEERIKWIKEQFPQTLLLFVTPPSAEILKERLTGRGTETEEVIHSRLSRAVEEADGCEVYDYLVVNDELDEAVENVHEIICSEQQRMRHNLDSIETIKNDLKQFVKGDLS